MSCLPLRVDGLLNAAGQVVKDGEGTPSVLAFSTDPLAVAKPIGAPTPGSVLFEIRHQGVCDDDPRH